MVTVQIPELDGSLNTPFPITLNNNRFMLVDEERYRKMEAAIKNVEALAEMKKLRIERKKKLAKSLFGILPADITLEEAREERLSKI